MLKWTWQTSTGTQREDIKQGGSDSTLEVNENKKSVVQKAKDDFVVALKVNFQKRFPKESTSVISVFGVLSLKSLPFISSQVQKLMIMAMKS